MSSSAKISSAVYNFLNKDCKVDDKVSEGWHIVWRLLIAPWNKFFIWRMLYGRTPTYYYLYDHNVDPNLDCPFCDL